MLPWCTRGYQRGRGGTGILPDKGLRGWHQLEVSRKETGYRTNLGELKRLGFHWIKFVNCIENLQIWAISEENQVVNV